MWSVAKLPEKYVVDTNVPITANRALDPAAIADELVDCVLTCVEAIEQVVFQGGIVLDQGDEIFDEYRRELRMQGQPGVGDRFIKWVHDNRWSLPDSDRVVITKNDDSYDELPAHDDLIHFDRSDCTSRIQGTPPVVTKHFFELPCRII